MNKNFYLSFVLMLGCFITTYGQQNDLRINYDANQGVSGLVGASKVYMYSGAVTSGPSGQWEWIIGSTNTDDGIGLMTSTGNDQWTICINPETYYSSGVAGSIPSGTPILAIDLFFRNANGSAFGYNFTGNYMIIDMTTVPPTSNFTGVTVGTCAVGGNEIKAGKFVMNNFPNPLTSNTLITYNLTEAAGKVNIKVFDMLGQQVKVFADENVKAGIHKFNWTGDDMKGIPLKNGIYFYSLEINGVTLRTNKLLISR